MLFNIEDERKWLPQTLSEMRDIELNNGCSLKRTFKQLHASFSLALSAAIKGRPHVFES
jgi:hypothetical protein